MLPSSGKFRNTRRPAKPIFPETLHLMLDDAEELHFSHIVSWQSHGRAFMIHNKSEFVSQVIPHYFNQSTFNSFRKQMTNYGFSKIWKKGHDHGAYFNPAFWRGMAAHLCTRENLSNSAPHCRTLDSEPNFSRMTPLPAVNHSCQGEGDSLGTITTGEKPSRYESRSPFAQGSNLSSPPWSPATTILSQRSGFDDPAPESLLLVHDESTTKSLSPVVLPVADDLWVLGSEAMAGEDAANESIAARGSGHSFNLDPCVDYMFYWDIEWDPTKRDYLMQLLPTAADLLHGFSSDSA